MAKPFESRIQDLVYNVDVGIGLQIIKVGLYVLMLILIILLYTASQFKAFNSEEAMDYAQLGRNLSRSGTLTTQVVRPSTMRFLIERNQTVRIEEREPLLDEDVEGPVREKKEIGGDPLVMSHPDVLHPPLYPAVMALLFKVKFLGVDFESDTTQDKYYPEQMIVTLCHFFAILTGVFLWLCGRLLFDNRVGVLGMTVFFLSDLVWSNSISGLNYNMTACLVTALFYFILVAGRNWEKESTLMRRLVPFLAASVLSVLMMLTRYGTVVVVPAVVLYIWLNFRSRRLLLIGIYLLICIVGMSPWMARNLRVSNSLFGMAPQTILVETGQFPKTQFHRTLAPDEKETTFPKLVRTVQGKWFRNGARYYKTEFQTLGDGFLMCLFMTTFLYKFARRNVHQFRWCLLLSMALLLGVAGLFGGTTIGLLFMFWPMVILYGLAFYFLLLDRLQLQLPIQRMAITFVIVTLSALPLIITLMPPKAHHPYPPYLRPYITYASELLEKNELLCTDMPWATAWYGDRTSLYLPQSIDEFYEINDYVMPISGIYFTTLTRNQPFVRGLLNGGERTWFPIQQGQSRSDFPLSHMLPLLNGDQLFLTDRQRWTEQGEEEEVEVVEEEGEAAG